MADFAAKIKVPTKEEAQEAAIKAWEGTKQGVQTLKDAGLFEMDFIMQFGKDLMLPFEPANFSVAAVQGLVLARLPDEGLKRGFTVMNAVVFLLELLGNLTAWLLGRGLFFVIIEFVYALLVAYGMYWLVVCVEGQDYKLVAIGLYVIYSMINTIQAVMTLALVLPPLFFFAKTIGSLSCAYYAFKIEKLKYGILQDDGVELGVAE